MIFLIKLYVVITIVILLKIIKNTGCENRKSLIINSNSNADYTFPLEDRVVQYYHLLKMAVVGFILKKN